MTFLADICQSLDKFGNFKFHCVLNIDNTLVDSDSTNGILIETERSKPPFSPFTLLSATDL